MSITDSPALTSTPVFGVTDAKATVFSTVINVVVLYPASLTLSKSTTTRLSPAFTCSFGLDLHIEAFAVHLHRVDADVHEHFHAIIGFDAECVTGFGDGLQHAGYRRDDGAVCRLDADASPSARDANTGSPVSSREITWPATGALTTVVVAAAAAGGSVLVAATVAVAVAAAGAAPWLRPTGQRSSDWRTCGPALRPSVPECGSRR